MLGGVGIGETGWSGLLMQIDLLLKTDALSRTPWKGKRAPGSPHDKEEWIKRQEGGMRNEDTIRSSSTKASQVQLVSTLQPS